MQKFNIEIIIVSILMQIIFNQAASAQLQIALSASDYNGYHISCFGMQDGSITATATGGQPPYIVSWSTGDTATSISALAAGYYRAYVLDANNQVESAEITLNQPELLRIVPSVFQFPNGYEISLYGACNGSLAATVTGGVSPYTFLWNDNNTNANRSTLCAGNMYLVVTDANGCNAATDQKTLRQPERSDWTMTGNMGSNPSTNFIGTTDNKDLSFRTNNPAHFYIKCHPKIKPTIDGNYIIGAAKATKLSANPNIGDHTMLIKVDGNGDTLWTHGYGYQNRVTFFSNMLPVSDGGYLLTGDFYGAISWPFGGCYVYKTDSLGYTSCGNVQELINITPLFPTDSNVVLLSVDDTVTVINASIAEFVSPLQSFVDDCIAVGMQQPQQSSGYQIYPNPTKGAITLDIPSPLKRDSFVTVYNSLGKIVLQKQIVLGPETSSGLQLDLSKYGKGIYLVKVSEGEKESSSKVVVE